MIKIPYSSWELRRALLGLPMEKFTTEKVAELKAEFPVPSDGKSGLDRMVAEYHGISVEKLLNSPNYNTLCREYEENILKKLSKKLVEKFGITDKEAWALIVYGLGLVKE